MREQLPSAVDPLAAEQQCRNAIKARSGVYSFWPVRHSPKQRGAKYCWIRTCDPVERGGVDYGSLRWIEFSQTLSCVHVTKYRDAVSSEPDPIVEVTVDRYVASLLDQLGVFHDSVQSVP
jgi:hypothetical protein